MLKKFLPLIIFPLLLSLLPFDTASAAFGISPPYLRSKQPLSPGSHYEQKITLLRSAQDDDLRARVVIEAPEIADWITVREGNEFDLPAGKTQVPMLVIVDVPDDAEIGDYKGYINVQIVPKESSGGGVSIALGARVDIDLSVTNETFQDFLIRRIDIPDFEAFKAPWKWQPFAWFFYRIKVAMNIENTGNVPIAPTKVVLDVYDATEKNRLESLEDTKMEKVDAFSTGQVVADFSTKLGPGQYWGNIKVYKDNDIVHKNKIIFNISEPGAMDNPPPLSKWAYVMMGFFLIILAVIVAILIKIKVWRYLGRFILIILWPVFFAGRKIKKLVAAIQKRFWRFMHKKAAQYQETDKRDTKD